MRKKIRKKDFENMSHVLVPIHKEKKNTSNSNNNRSVFFLSSTDGRNLPHLSCPKLIL